MKLPSLVIFGYLFTLTSCVPPKRPQLKSTKSSAEREQNQEESTFEDESSSADSEPDSDADKKSKTGSSEENSTGSDAGKDTGKDQGKDKGTVDTDKGSETPSEKPMPVPASNKVVYRPLGLGSGGYQSVREYVWPDKCVKGSLVPTTGPLFPFNEPQTVVVRGPLDLAEIAVYEKKDSKWSRIADIKDLQWKENSFGSIKDIGTYPMKGKTLENGREFFSHLPSQGEKILVAKLKMPMPTSAPFNAASQDNVPALWMLNSNIFKTPSVQYGCNCRGMGNPGGCGELDIAEIIPDKPTEITTTIYTYEGARGGFLKNPRPTSHYQIYAAVLRVDGNAGEVAVLEMDSFDFSMTEIPDSFVKSDWLPTAKLLNKGSEALIPPGK